VANRSSPLLPMDGQKMLKKSGGLWEEQNTLIEMWGENVLKGDGKGGVTEKKEWKGEVAFYSSGV